MGLKLPSSAPTPPFPADTLPPPAGAAAPEKTPAELAQESAKSVMSDYLKKLRDNLSAQQSLIAKVRTASPEELSQIASLQSEANTLAEMIKNTAAQHKISVDEVTFRPKSKTIVTDTALFEAKAEASGLTKELRDLGVVSVIIDVKKLEQYFVARPGAKEVLGSLIATIPDGGGVYGIPKNPSLV